MIIKFKRKIGVSERYDYNIATLKLLVTAIFIFKNNEDNEKTSEKSTISIGFFKLNLEYKLF